MTEVCKMCGEDIFICRSCVEQERDEDEAKLKARIAELERQLVESRDFAISEAAKIRAKYEHQQAVLVEALTEYMAAYNEHWERGMPILEPMGDSALAAVKPAGQEGSDRV